jgi:phosphoribosylformylglycinamidine synthase
MIMPPKALILRTAGTNCDGETSHAFELAGANAKRIHLNRVLEEPRVLEAFQILAIPGGFSYGDDISSGKIFANQITQHLAEPLARFVEAGKPIIGICNGFQVLIKTALLPGKLGVANCPAQPATLTHNDCGRFIDRWVHLKTASDKCIWTRGIDQIELPIAHGEGKFVPANDDVRKWLWEQRQIALLYDGENPNGSIDDIAGICDTSGLVFGLMPHPERYVSGYQHPNWSRTRMGESQGPGVQIFRNAVSYADEAVGTGV